MRNRALAIAAILLAIAGVSPAQSTQGQFLGAKPTEYPDWFKESFLDLADDVDEAREENRRVLIMFHQDGCPYCNALVERNLAQKDIEEKMRASFDVIALNMWGDRDVALVDGKRYTEKTFAAALRVQYTPTLVFLDESGRSVLRLNGYLPPREFRVALDYVAGRHEDTAWRDYVRANLSHSAGGALIPEPFFLAPPFVLSRGAQSRPLAVFFEQTDCPNCRTLHERALADPPTRELIERFDAVQLDMWSDTPIITPDGQRTTASAWAKTLGVAYAPTIVYFDADGTEVIRSAAWFKIFHTQSVMDYVLSGAYREEPSFQRYISARAEHIREQGVDVDIWR